jgi:hypothetical protein
MHSEVRAVAQYIDPDGRFNFLSVKYNVNKDPIDQTSRLQVPKTPEDSPIQQDKWEDPPPKWDNSSNWTQSWANEHVPRDQYPTPDRRGPSSENDALYPPSQNFQRKRDETQQQLERQ